MRKLPVSVVIPVLNEEKNLQAALESVAWADEVFVVDSGSTDRTTEIAHQQGAEVVEFQFQPGAPRKKGWSLRNLPFSHDWALYLDADERVPEALAAEIAQALVNRAHDGYYVERHFIFVDKRLRSYRRDWNLRLFRHTLARIEDLGLQDLAGTGDNEIHEHFQVSGSAGYLRTPLLHDDYRGIGPWIERHNRYATWEAHLYRRFRQEPVHFSLAALRDPVARNRLGRRIWVRLPARPLLRFSLWFFVKGAVRDGLRGLQYSFLMGWHELVISFKLAELDEAPRAPVGEGRVPAGQNAQRMDGAAPAPVNAVATLSNRE